MNNFTQKIWHGIKIFFGCIFILEIPVVIFASKNMDNSQNSLIISFVCSAIFAALAYLCFRKPKSPKTPVANRFTSHMVSPQKNSTTPPIPSRKNVSSNTGVINSAELISQNNALLKENERLRQLLTPEMQDAAALSEHIAQLQERSNALTEDIDRMSKELETKRQQLVIFDEDVSVQEFGLYKPRYSFANSSQYKERLDAIRSLEKECLKQGTAATGYMSMLFNGSPSQGRKLVQDMQKLLLRAFNSECDEVINKVKYNNFDASYKKINSCAEQIAKLGKMMQIAVTPQYFSYKIEELQLALEFQIKKQEEKELQKQLRAEERERIRLEKELEEQRKKIEKEQLHYQKALISVLKQMEDSDKANDEDLIVKKTELENQLGIISSNLKELDYREANQRAGYVYIISNIGSFGKDIYKIGMTRRLDPMDRVDELGDASVPFNFDVHAMIFTDDAPKLEAALHKAFADRKVNMVNTRREFFHVTLDEIKEVIKNNYDKTVEFTDYPDADQYRISLKMRDNAVAESA